MKKLKKISIAVISIIICVSGVMYSNSVKPSSEREVSEWAVKELTRAENYNIFSTEWYYRNFQDDITEERLTTIVQGTAQKIDNLDLVAKEDYTIAQISKPFTYEKVINSLYAILSQYEVDEINVNALDYFKENNLLTDIPYNNDEVPTSEYAIVLATRFIENIYDKFDAGTKGFAWSVSNDKNTIYLLGSIHVGASYLYPLDKDLIDAFDSSQMLAVEANVLPNSGENIEKYWEIADYRDGTTIQDHVSTDTYEKVSKVATKLELSLSQISKFKPWSFISEVGAVASFKNQSKEKEEIEFYQGIDRYFLTNSNSKDIEELENLTYLAKLQDNMSMEYQEKELNEFLDYILDSEYSNEGSLDLTNEWLEYYVQGDIVSFTNSVNESDGMNKEEQEIFDYRNIEMTKKITEMLESDGENTFFVIVGAAHFINEGSIIDILENTGYLVDEFYY